MTPNKCGALAAFLLAIAFVVAPLIYLTGSLRTALGVLAYDLADFLHGPLLAASLVTVTYVLREQLGARAKRRMDLALCAAVIAAAGLAAVAFIRAANRHYHLDYPELSLENSTTVLIVWATLVAGVSGLGLHFLGWVFVLIGAAGWTAGRWPRALCVFYFLAGGVAWFAYLRPDLDGLVLTLGAVISVMQGLWLWKQPAQAG